MNKKAFTLIEIIISIVLITIIGVSSIVGVNYINKKNNISLEKINNKILEAANIFVEYEKDENGNSYLKEVSKGAKGVKIPLSLLVNKGYLEKNTLDSLYDSVPKLNAEKQDGKTPYVLFLSDGEDYCNKNLITSLLPWMEDTSNPVYLCKNYEDGSPGGETEETMAEIILSYYKENEIIELKTISVYDYIYSNQFSSNSNKFPTYADFSLQNGLCYKDNELPDNYQEEIYGDKYYYYRGEVDDNYVVLLDKKYRILGFDKKRLKLITQEDTWITTEVDKQYKLNLEFLHSDLGPIASFFSEITVECDSKWGYSIETCNYGMTGIFKIEDCENIKSERSFNNGINESYKPCTTKTSYQSEYGLLSVSDAFDAGIPMHLYDGRDYALGNSWLKTLPTITSGTDSSDYNNSILIIQNETYKVNNYATLMKIGVLNTVNPDDSNEFNKAKYHLVQWVDMDKLRLVSGGGTKANPYKLEPKKEK